METVSSTNRFRRSLGTLTTTATGNNINNQQRPEKEQCLFDIYKKEGDNFFIKRKFKKAVDSYSLALTNQPKNLTVMVARSRCYAKLGQLQHALRDAETALDIDSTHAPALYQKAQVLYSMEHYDTALLFFHKGQKLNPNAPGFSEGVEKAQKALNHLPPGRRMKTTEAGDISMYIPRRPYFRRYKPAQSHNNINPNPELPPISPSFRSSQMCKLVSLELEKKAPSTLDTLLQQPPERVGDKHVPKVSRPSPSSMRDVLTQLYTDKAYFEKILRDMEATGRFHEDVFQLAGDGLAFVAERMLFWARFGAPAPQACPSGSGFKSRKTNHGGLQPVLSARSRDASAGENVLTSELEEEEMTSRDAGDREGRGVTWRDLQEDSTTSNNQDQDGEDQRRRNGQIQSERGKARVSGDHQVKKRKLQKRRKKKTAVGEKGDNLTSDAEKLTFNFDTYRPSPVTAGNSKDPPQTQRSSEGVPHLVRTVEDISTDDWDSEWDDCEEADPVQASSSYRSRRRTHRDGEGDKTDDVVTSSENHVTVQDEANTEDNPDPVRLYLLRVIRDIHAEFDKGGYLMVREKVHGVLADLDKYRSEFMADKMDLVATLHSLLGNAYLEIHDYGLALQHHNQDFSIGQDRKNNTITSRALGNLGRVHVACKDFYAALECFAGKSKHVSTHLEKAWLYHEISNCFLQLRHYEFARDAAAKALDVASLVRSSVYQLQAAVLLGVSEVQLKKYEQAHEHFTLALQQATLREDVKAESSIRSALHQVNDKLAAAARERQPACISPPHIADREKAKTSEDEADDPELADLKESESESEDSPELQVIQAAAALVALSAKSSRQPAPPAPSLATEGAEGLVLQRQQTDKQSPDPQRFSSPPGANPENATPQVVKQGEKPSVQT